MRDMIHLVVVAVFAAVTPSLADPAVDTSVQSIANAPTPPVTSSVSAKPTPIAQPITPTVVSKTDGGADMIICHENQAATGSRLGASRECHSKREWDKRRADNERTIENAQQIGLTGNPPGN